MAKYFRLTLLSHRLRATMTEPVYCVQRRLLLASRLHATTCQSDVNSTRVQILTEDLYAMRVYLCRSDDRCCAVRPPYS